MASITSLFSIELNLDCMLDFTSAISPLLILVVKKKKN